MSEEKKSRGRPRKYPTNAARKKAYRERKKAERLELEKKVAELEKKINEDDETVDENISIFQNLTFENIKKMEIFQLEDYKSILASKINQEINLFSPLHNLIDDIMNEFENSDIYSSNKNKQSITQITKTKLLDAIDSIQLLTLHHIIETELGQRKEQDITDIEMDILEQRILALENELSKKKENKLLTQIKKTSDD
ncbi:MAG: hypothetical protein EAX90_14850 [Candidatus Heimdallarchaeota archaeon]|nr:hypothetical protein [Candidatus Heimdallarchaeota archaeon]